MSEENEVEIDPDLVAAELSALKDRANSIGVSYHPNIGYDKLVEKIKAFEAEKEKDKPPVEAAAKTAPTKSQKMVKLKKEQTALVRIRVTCMNPAKREWEGEVFTVSNRVVGTVKKMVPFDVVWHVPRIMLNVIRERECQVFQSVRGTDGRTQRKGKMVKEFAIEELKALTSAEIKDLAQRQAMANGTAESL